VVAGHFVYAGEGAKKGLWLSGKSETKPRCLVKGVDVRHTAWSPKGNKIAIVAYDARRKVLRLQFVAADGRSRTDSGPVTDPFCSWSPSGENLLVRKSDGYQVWSPKTKAWSRVGAKDMEWPVWLADNRLRTTQNGVAFSLKLDKKWTREPENTRLTSRSPEGSKLIASIPCASLPVPVATVEPVPNVEGVATLDPSAGRLRLNGVVSSVDSKSSRIGITVESVVRPDGSVLHLKNPLVQVVELQDSATRIDVEGSDPLKKSDVRKGAKIAALVEGTRISANTELPLLAATLTSPPQTSSPPKVAATRTGASPRGGPVHIVFPVVGKVHWTDTFLASRGGGSRRHKGQDIMAAKMTPLVAAFDGVVHLTHGTGRGKHYTLTLIGDNGWTANYYHINNDTPGTDDNKGGDKYAFAPGLKSGDRVKAGQFVAYCGDSGNAEGGASHLHFELWHRGGSVVNAAPALRAAEKISAPLKASTKGDVACMKGESRWDVVLRSVDVENRTIVVSVKVRYANGRPTVVKQRKDLTIAIPEGAELILAGEKSQKLALGDLEPGITLNVVGKLGSDGGIEPRLIAANDPDGD